MQNTPKSKTQKKTDNKIRIALTKVCEQALEDIDGFKWLTHQANYANFPASLLITCIFETDSSLALAQQQGSTADIQKRIQAILLKTGILFKGLERQVIFDTEEACIREDDHDWVQRLTKQYGRAVPHSKRP